MPAKKITIDLVAEPGDRVWVKNYRIKPQTSADAWELGEVVDIDATINKYRELPSVSYRVRLDRKSKNGNLLFLYVGSDAIRFIR